MKNNAVLNMKFFLIFFKICIPLIIFFFSYSLVIAHPAERDDMIFDYKTKELLFKLSDYYNYQIDLHYNLYGSKGYFKNIHAEAIDLTCGFRQIDNNPQFKYKFVLLNWQGLMPSVLGSVIKDGAVKTREFLFSQFGVKFFEWDKLDYFESDLTYLKLNFNLLFEDRKFNPNENLIGLPFFPGNDNLYFISDGHIALTNIILNNNFNLNNSQLSNDIFGFEYGYNLELGFELKKMVDDYYVINNVRQEVSYYEKNSISLNLDRRYIFGKALNTLDYGLTIKSESLCKYFRVIASFKNCTVNYYYQQSNNNFISLGISR